MGGTKPRRAMGIWIRVSTEDQAKGDSPEHHERRARAYAEAKGWDVSEIYRLEGVSGKNGRSHPEAERMLADIASGRISGLIFSKLARLARSTKDLLEFSELFREHDADLVSLQESIDTSTPAGRLFYTVIAAMAQWEREEISERVAASVPIRAKLGKRLGGQPPYGYRWCDGKLELDPVEAPIRKRMFDLFLEHRRKKSVATTLNDAGLRTRNGSLFCGTTVGRLLRDPIAKGERRANYTRSVDGRKWTYKPRDEWVILPVPPIVSEDVWSSVNAILAQQRRGRRAARRPAHLFSGLAFCQCGGKMYVPSNTPKYVCQVCRNKIPIEDLAGVFHEQLRNFFLSDDDVGAYLAQAQGAIQDQHRVIESMETEKKRVQKEMDQVYQLYVGGELGSEGFGRRNRPLEARLYQLEDEIPRAQSALDLLKVQYMDSDQVLGSARDLFERWPGLSAVDQREIVENTVTRIEIGEVDVEIHLAYLPSSSQGMATRERNPKASFPNAT